MLTRETRRRVPGLQVVLVFRARASEGGGSQTCQIFIAPCEVAFWCEGTQGGILRTPRHRFTREGSLSRWDVDAKYHSVANHIETLPVRVFFPK